MTHFQMNAPSTLSKLYSTPLSNKLSLSNRRPYENRPCHGFRRQLDKWWNALEITVFVSEIE